MLANMLRMIKPASTSTVYTDNFNRANGAVGSPWVDIPSYTGMSIVSNQIQRSTTGDWFSVYNASLANNQYAQISVGTTVGNDSNVGIQLRAGTTALSGYEGSVYYLNGTWYYFVLRRTSPVAIYANQVALGYTPSKCKLAVSGTTLTFYVWNTSNVMTTYGPWTDTSTPAITSGLAGMRIHCGLALTNTMDNFECGNL